MMAEDEQKKDETIEQDAPQDEAPKQDEAQDEGGQAAGPVAEGSPPAHPPEGQPSTPPAAEASEAEDEAPAEAAPDGEEKAGEPEAAAEEPAAEEKAEEAAEPSEEDQLPWKEKRRLEKSRRPHKARPQQSPEERKAARAAERKRRGGERRKERAAAKAKKTPGTGTPAAEKDANAAKVRQGVVVSDKGQKSITVRVDIVRRHPTYEKVIRRSRTLHAHDERNEAGEGDVVRVVETRPLSKTKRWRLVEVLEKAK
jgi:small subunit ribosomal protein S17